MDKSVRIPVFAGMTVAKLPKCDSHGDEGITENPDGQGRAFDNLPRCFYNYE